MTTRKDHKHNVVHVNFLLNGGGLGDYITCLPALKYIRDSQPHVVLHVWVSDFFLELAKNLLPSDVIVKPFSKGINEYNEDLPGRKNDSKEHDTLKTHLVDHAFHLLSNNQMTDVTKKNYLTLNSKNISLNKFNLPDKYVVITTGFTSEVREFEPKTTNEVVQYVKSKGYDIVFLGSTKADIGAYGKSIIGNFNTEIDYTQGLNLVNHTSLLEAAKIIEGAKTIVGVDNGLLHLAATTDIPIVGGFTTLKPEHRMPYRHDELGWNFYPVVPPESLACRFCQSNWDFVYEISFTKCYYKEKAMDTEIKCVKSLTSDLFIAQLEKIL